MRQAIYYKNMKSNNGIKELREQLNMNREEFSKYFNIPYRTISDWESGRRKMPDYVLNLMKYKANNDNKNNSTYYLKLFDKTLITFKMERELSLKIFDIEIISKEKNLFPEILKNEVNSETIEEFLKQRIVPKNRAFVSEILDSYNLNLKDTKGIIDICKGLSLNDCYWVVDNDDLKFKDYNLYDNEFSNALSIIAFTGYASKIRGIASSPEFSTDGALPKSWRRINGQIYLYKGSTESWHFSNTGFEPYSEFYASQIAKAMSINCVEYDLKRWKGMLASVCKLFTSKEYSYVPIWLASGHKNIEDIYKWCTDNGFKEEFIDMILFDSLILNHDRHLGNFGVLKNNKTGKYEKFAPLFDNGEGLLAKGSIEAFNNIDSLLDYVNTKETLSYYGIEYNKLVEAFCDKKQISKLRKVLTFKFKEDNTYKLSRKRTKLLEDFIHIRANELINIIENHL